MDPPGRVPETREVGARSQTWITSLQDPTPGLPPLCAFVHTGAGGDGCGPISVPRSWAWRGLESSEQGFNASSSPLRVLPALEGGLPTTSIEQVQWMESF